MSLPASQETQSHTEFDPLFARNTVRFLESYFPVLEGLPNITENDVFEASQIIAEAKIDMSTKNYFAGLNVQNAEPYNKVVAMLKKKQNTQHEEDENYRNVAPSDLLEYILTLTRRDEFMQFVAAATMQADLHKRAQTLPPGDPKMPQALKNPEEYGFKNSEELIKELDFSDEESQKLIAKLSTFVDKETENEKKSSARAALRAFSFFNYIFPVGDIRRPSMLRKLGLPADLPYAERRPAITPDEGTLKQILRTGGNKVPVPLPA